MSLWLVASIAGCQQATALPGQTEAETGAAALTQDGITLIKPAQITGTAPANLQGILSAQ